MVATRVEAVDHGYIQYWNIYYGYSHVHGYVYIPNIVYKSLDVRHIEVFLELQISSARRRWGMS